MTNKQIARIFRIAAKAVIAKQNWVSEARDSRLLQHGENHQVWLAHKIQRYDRWISWSMNKINSLPSE